MRKKGYHFFRHDLYKKEWKAIGKTLATGFNDTGYFPTMISKSFLQYCFYGDVSKENVHKQSLKLLDKKLYKCI